MGEQGFQGWGKRLGATCRLAESLPDSTGKETGKGGLPSATICGDVGLTDATPPPPLSLAEAPFLEHLAALSTPLGACSEGVLAQGRG